MYDFELGDVVVTNAVWEVQREDRYFDLFVRLSLSRYRNCDWGDTCAVDAKADDYAIDHDRRILAVYVFDTEDMLNYLAANSCRDDGPDWVPKKREEKDPNGRTIWIITEWDRSVTTVLFPSDY